VNSDIFVPLGNLFMMMMLLMVGMLIVISSHIREKHVKTLKFD